MVVEQEVLFESKGLALPGTLTFHDGNVRSAKPGNVQAPAAEAGGSVEAYFCSRRRIRSVPITSRNETSPSSRAAL
jgi:hypothetical protein